MKIEIGENLVYSYLKHIEGCRIVQTNWKTSGLWSISEKDKKQAEYLFKEFKKIKSLKGVFKQNEFDQLIKQAEIDILGVNNEESSIFGIEIAFHSSGTGLNYSGGKEESVLKVFHKLLKNILIMKCYFNDYDKYNVYFVTPKASDYIRENVKNIIKDVNELLKDDSINIDFISNDDFYNCIVNPLISDDFNEHDNSELFLRAMKLLKMDNRINSVINNKTLEQDVKVKRNEKNMKIGQFVQFKMNEFQEKNLLSDKEKENLLDKDYSNKTFGLNFPVLGTEIKDELGRNRYYSKEKYFGYYLTSQWYERHWDLLLKWIEKIES